MPERHKYEDKEIIVMEIVKVGDKWVQKETTETKSFLAWEDHDLYNEDGEVIGIHRAPVLESYEEFEERELKERGSGINS